jgi:hypothetical protein
MKGAETFRGNATGLCYAGYFAWLVAAVFGFHAFGIVSEEYIAQHRWPVASGEVTSAEEKSRRYPGTSSSSTVYFTRFTVEFDPPLEECGPGMLLTIVGRPTRCTGTLDSLEGSSDSAYQFLRRHPVGSHISVHYQPRGTGLRFAGEFTADIYPWKKIFVTFVIFFAGWGLLRLARWRDENETERAPATRQNTEDAAGSDERIDSTLR